MTRLAILSRIRVTGSLGVLGACSMLACSSSSQPNTSGTGGLPGLGGSSATSANSGGSAALVTTTSEASGAGGASGGFLAISGGANATSGGTGTLTSTTRAVASGGATVVGAGGTIANASGGAATTAGNKAISTGGTKSNGTGGALTVTGGTRASGGVSASAIGGTQPVASGGASITATGGSANSAPSEGCNAAGTPESGRFSIQVGTTAREYIIKLPTDYDAKHPYRLIFAFHGRQYSAESVATGGPPGSGPYYGIESEANGSAIFVAPQALSTSWNPESDLAFVTAMVSRFETELCIDKNRVFSTGFSMGAIMTIAIGCSQADVFRAIAPMSGSLQGSCSGSRPIAYWASHGTKDPTIPIANGEAARDVFVERNGCKADATPGTPSGCMNYSCSEGYPTTWCTFDGVHEPPPFAGQAIWAFFAQF